jgi:hypothetical protein
MLLKPAAQKEMMDWNSSMSSRLCVTRLSFLWSYGVFRCFTSLESCQSLETLFM